MVILKNAIKFSKFVSNNFIMNSKLILLSICLAFFFSTIQHLSGQINSDESKANANEFYKQANELYGAGDFQKAGEAYSQSFNLFNYGYAAYNGACAYSLAGDSKNAIKYARLALEMGILNFDEDPDFENVRELDEFKAIANEGRKKLSELQKQSTDPIVVEPPDFDANKKYGLIVAMHGYGSNPTDFSSVYESVAAEYDCIIMSSRATEVLGENSFAWTYSDEEHKRLETEINEMKSRYKIDDQKVVLTGFSQGGRLTYSLGTRLSEIFCGLIPVAGRFEDGEQVAKMKNKDLKVFSIIGTKDRPTFTEENERAQKLFEEVGIDFKLNKFDVGHSYPPNREEVISEALDWFFEK
jgi:predicted esterase